MSGNSEALGSHIPFNHSNPASSPGIPKTIVSGLRIHTTTMFLAGISVTVGLWSFSRMLYQGENATLEELEGGISLLCLFSSLALGLYILSEIQLLVGSSALAFYRKENGTGSISWVVLGMSIAGAVVITFRFIYIASLNASAGGLSDIKGDAIPPIYWLGGLSSSLFAISWSTAGWMLSTHLRERALTVAGSSIYMLTGIAGSAMTSYSLSSILNNKIPEFFMYGFWVDYFGGGCGAVMLTIAFTKIRNKKMEGRKG